MSKKETKHLDWEQLQKDRMFYEKEISPIRANLYWVNPEKKKEKVVELIYQDNGNELIAELIDSHAINRFYYLVEGPSGNNSLPKLELEEQEAVLNQFFKEKQPIYKLLKDNAGKVVSVVSTQHKQIPHTKVYKAVEKAIKEAFNLKKVETEQSVGNSIAYKIPTDSKYVDLYAGVDPGNNLVKGRSGIRVNIKFRTVFDTKSGGISAPCLNWANLWQTPLQWFKLKVDRTYNLAKVEMTNLEGEEITQVPQDQFYYFDIHIENTEIIPEIFVEKLKELKNFAENVVIKTMVNPAIEEQLTPEEVLDILHAYSGRVGWKGTIQLPAYVINAILVEFMSRKEFTVWGFSQAISYVRTHGELRGLKNTDRNQLSLTETLENIAGEILSLSPTIIAFHKEVGSITFSKLTEQPKVIENPEKIPIPLTIEAIQVPNNS